MQLAHIALILELTSSRPPGDSSRVRFTRNIRRVIQSILSTHPSVYPLVHQSVFSLDPQRRRIGQVHPMTSRKRANQKSYFSSPQARDVRRLCAKATEVTSRASTTERAGGRGIRSHRNPSIRPRAFRSRERRGPRMGAPAKWRRSSGQDYVISVPPIRHQCQFNGGL
jgi:hypothetical protein